MREIPSKSCLACGGNWFREAAYYEFLREETLGGFWPTWPELVGQIGPGAMPLLVCLCGTPLSPSIGGVRGGHTFNAILLHLLACLKGCHARLEDLHDRGPVLTQAEEHLAKLESFRILADQLTALERRAGKAVAQLNPSRKSPSGRYWAPPKRQPLSAGKGVLTRDTLVIALQQIGLTARTAKPVVKTILQTIINHLKVGGMAETPLGVFKVVHGPLERTLYRLGKQRKMYTKPRKAVFRPSRELRAACNRSIQPEVPVPVSHQTTRPDQLSCEKCGSIYFVEAAFHRYRQQYSSSPGGDLSPLTKEPVRALVCLCGHPILPGRLRSVAVPDYESFQQSFEAARQYREGATSETIMEKLEGLYASKGQHDDLADRIARLQTILKELPQPSRRK